MIQRIDQFGIINIYKGKSTEPIKLIVGEILTAEIMDILPTGTIQVKINDRILNAQMQRDLQLQSGDTVLVKVEKPLEDGTIPLRILSPPEAEQIQKGIFISEGEISEKILKLLESLFSELTNQPKDIKNLQTELIKNLLSTPLENLSETEKTALLQKAFEVIFSRSTVSDGIRDLISLLEAADFDKSQIAKLKAIVVEHPEELTPEKLKQVILNSGVSFEAKLKQAVVVAEKIETVKEDLKVILNSIIKDAKAQGFEEVSEKAQQILRQIEGYQVLSKTFQSFFTFLPIFWKDLGSADIAYKTLKRQGKEYHAVFVNLNFKDEPLSFVVTMINKSFYVTFAGQPKTLQIIKEQEGDLKGRFNIKGMPLSSVNYVSKTEELIKQWDVKEGSISLKV